MNQYQDGLLDFIKMVIEMDSQEVHATNDSILKIGTVEIDQEIEAIDIQLNLNYN